MNNKSTEKSEQKHKGIFVPKIKLSGPKNMALDIFLLNKLIAENKYSLAFRFYEWDGLWLSIGRNQIEIPSKWKTLESQNKLKIVRRPSGGNAVIHGQGITYALIWKSPPKKRKEAYFKASEWIIKGFSQLDYPLKFGNEGYNLIESDCFSSSSSADLIDIDGVKRVGSAQFWEQGSLLQHGEILIDPPQKLLMNIFGSTKSKKSSIKIKNSILEEALIKSLRQCWMDVNWEIMNISPEELNQITIQSKNYYWNEV